MKNTFDNFAKWKTLRRNFAKKWRETARAGDSWGSTTSSEQDDGEYRRRILPKWCQLQTRQSRKWRPTCGFDLLQFDSNVFEHNSIWFQMSLREMLMLTKVSNLSISLQIATCCRTQRLPSRTTTSQGLPKRSLQRKCHRSRRSARCRSFGERVRWFKKVSVDVFLHVFVIVSCS